MAIARKTRTRVYTRETRSCADPLPQIAKAGNAHHRRRERPHCVANSAAVRARARVIYARRVNYYSNNLSAITLPRPRRSAEVIARCLDNNKVRISFSNSAFQTHRLLKVIIYE